MDLRRYLITMASVLACGGCATLPAPSQGTLSMVNTVWDVVSVSGDTLSKPGSQMQFGRSSFRADLPCSTVAGTFVQDGDVLRFSDVGTVIKKCTPTGQEQYFAGKLGAGITFSPTVEGVNLIKPPDYIELKRR